MTTTNNFASSLSSFDKLRTSDQYEPWRTRIADKCWGKTGKDILAVTDQACTAALHKLRTEETKGTKEAAALVAANCWVTECWMTITKSLHDDILMKVAHVERGLIETLLKEIAVVWRTVKSLSKLSI